MSRGCDKSLRKSALVVSAAAASVAADIRGAEPKRLIFDAEKATSHCLDTAMHQWDKSFSIQVDDLLIQCRSFCHRLWPIVLTSVDCAQDSESL